MKSWKPLLIALAIGLQGTAFAAAIPVKLYRNPNCGCCETYAQYLNANGFSVQSIDTNDKAAMKQKDAVPANVGGCHTLPRGWVRQMPASLSVAAGENLLPLWRYESLPEKGGVLLLADG